MRMLAAVSSSVVALAVALPAQDVPAPERFRSARAAVLAEVERELVPSIAVAVFDGDDVVWAEGFGLADVERQRRANADTIYRLASISKPFTATALMQLVDRGLVDLDAPANRYLDEPLRAFRGAAGEITIRRLANHTGGLPTHWNFFYEPEQPPDRDETIRAFGFAVYAPGTRTNYSNLAFGVLDHVVARIGRKHYRSWLVDELLDPLGMHHTDVGVRPGAEAHAACGYRRENGAWQSVTDYGFDHDGASAVRSSANDLMRFARLQIDASNEDEAAGDGARAGDGPPLSGRALLAMRELRGADAGSSFGVGWSVGERRGQQVLQHSGGMPGVSTQLLVFPAARKAVAVLTNGDDRGATHRSLMAILDVLFGPRQPGVPAEPAPPEHVQPVAAGRWRGVLAHPSGAVPVQVTATWPTDSGGGSWSSMQWQVQVGDAAPVAARPERPLRQRPLSLQVESDVDVGHGERRATRLRFELEPTATGFAGVAYADAASVCRLPFWCELHREAARDDDELRVVSYNVLFGFRDSEVGRFLPGCRREAAIASWLASERPDVVALQEMNGYTEASLLQLARAWGHRHVALLKERGYPVALTSSRAIEVRARHVDGLHHGMLHATTHGVDFVVVHFRPMPGVEAKLDEARAALEHYRSALAAGRECVVLGDFNSLHPAEVYRLSEGATETYRKWRYATQDGLASEVAMGPLLDAGAGDTFQARGAIPAELPLPRIDFVLASPRLLARCSSSRWLCEEPFRKWSDHPPVVADFAR